MPYTLNTRDQWFLVMGRKDPLTGGQFQIGDSVVVCRRCRTVHLTDTWYFAPNGCKAPGCGCTNHAANFSRDAVAFSSITIKKSTPQSGSRPGSARNGTSGSRAGVGGSDSSGNGLLIPILVFAILAVTLILLLSKCGPDTLVQEPTNPIVSEVGDLQNGAADEIGSISGIVSEPSGEEMEIIPTLEPVITAPWETQITELHIPACDWMALYIDDMESSSTSVNRADIDRSVYHLSEGQEIRHQFAIPRDGRYLVDIEDMDTNIVLEAEIFDSQGKVVVSDSYFILGDSFTLKGLLAGEVYTLLLRQNKGTGPLTVVIGNQKPHVDVTGYTHIYDSTEFQDQRNVYSFTVPRSGRYRFQLDGMPSGVVLELYIFDAQGDVVSSDEYAVSGDGLTLKGLNAGEKYQIQVRQQRSYSEYTLFIGYQKEILDVTGYTNLHDSVQYQDQRNVYFYTIPVSGRYRVQLQELSSDTVVELYVFDNQGEVVASDEYAICGDGLTLKGLEAGEEYEIQVRQHKGTSDYELTLGCQKLVNSVTTDMDVEDSIEFIDQRNVYEFFANSDDPVTVSIAELNSDCVVELIVFDEGGEAVVQDTYCIDGDSLDFTPLPGRTYQIQVRYSKGFSQYQLALR